MAESPTEDKNAAPAGGGQADETTRTEFSETLHVGHDSGECHDQDQRKSTRAISLLREAKSHLDRFIEQAKKAPKEAYPLDHPDPLRMAVRYLTELGYTADAGRLLASNRRLQDGASDVFLCDYVRKEPEKCLSLRDRFGPFPLPAEDPAEHERLQELRRSAILGAAVQLTELIGGILTDLGHDSDGENGTPATDYRVVQRRLLALREQGEPYTTMADLAKRMGCSRSTVHKATQNSRELEDWKKHHMAKRKRSPKAGQWNEVVEDRTAQTREGDPADVLPDEDVEKIMAILIAQAEADRKTDEVGKLHASTADERRELARAYHEMHPD